MKKILALLMVVVAVLASFMVVDADQAIDFSRYDAIYQEAFERWNIWDTPLQEIYEEYGTMNGDYYRIALEEVILRLDDKPAGSPVVVNAIHDQLVKNKAISIDIRKSLREAVAKYGLDEGLIPDDPDFIDKTAETPKPNPGGSVIGMSDKEIWEMLGKSEQEVQEMMESGGYWPEDSDNTTPPAGNTAFADVDPDAWYAEAVEAMTASGLVKGKDDGLFHPDDTITIGEWCTLLYRITYKDPVDIPSWTNNEATYDHWAAGAIERCRKADLTEMVLSIDVYPEGGKVWDALTQRGEAMSAVSRILLEVKYGDKFGKTTVDGPWTWDQIPDSNVVLEGTTARDYEFMGYPNFDSTHYWTSQMVLNAYNLGFVNGIDDVGTCDPTGLMTRAQACQMLYKAGLDHNVGVYDVIRGGIR